MMYTNIEASSREAFGEGRTISLRTMCSALVHMLVVTGRSTHAVTPKVALQALKIIRKVRWWWWWWGRCARVCACVFAGAQTHCCVRSSALLLRGCVGCERLRCAA